MKFAEQAHAVEDGGFAGPLVFGWWGCGEAGSAPFPADCGQALV